MYKDSKRTCTAIVLLTKPFVWRRSRCRRRRGLLKLYIGNQAAIPITQSGLICLFRRCVRYITVLI